MHHLACELVKLEVSELVKLEVSEVIIKIIFSLFRLNTLFHFSYPLQLWCIHCELLQGVVILRYSRKTTTCNSHSFSRQVTHFITITLIGNTNVLRSVNVNQIFQSK